MPATAAACALAVATPAHARRLPLRPLDAAAVATPRLFMPRVPDRVLVRAPRAQAAKRARSAASSAVFRTGDGTPIPVQVSAAYAPNPAVEQGYVNFLGGLVHGSELGKLSVYIATPSEIEKTFCGDGALACYVGDEERMYVPGVNEHSDPPVQFLIAHEYGHHIELNRSNAPWSAFDRGVKYWATYENVCALERRRRTRSRCTAPSARPAPPRRPSRCRPPWTERRASISLHQSTATTAIVSWRRAG